MADRKIDAIGKADAAGWKSTQLPKGSPNLVRLVSGVLSNTTTGSVMHSMVQKAANDAFKVSLNGESFIIKGLPASLAGKEVAFIVQKSSTQPNAKAELFWIGANQSGGSEKQTNNTPTSPTNQQSPLQTANSRLTNILSTLPTEIKPGQNLSGHIASIHGKQMSISMIIPDPKNPTKMNQHTILTSSINGMKEGQQIAAKVIPDINNKPMLEITLQQSLKARLLSALPAGVRTGQSLSARIDTIHGKQMSVSMMVPAPQNPTKTNQQTVLTTSINSMKEGQYITAKVIAGMDNRAILEVTPQQNIKANILSALPTGLKTGQSLLAHIDLIHGKQMSVSVMVPDAKNPEQTKQQTILTSSINGMKDGQLMAAKIIPDINNKPMLEIFPQQSMKANLLSPLPTGMKTGQVISAHIDSIHDKHMNTTMMIPDTKDPSKTNPQALLTTRIDGIKEGQHIAAKVIAGIDNKPALEVMAQQGTNQPDSKANKPINTMAQFKLAAGETTPAFVQKRLENGNVQLNIQGKIVETAAPVSVQKGDLLMLKMNKPPSDFQLLSIHKNADAKALATLKTNLAGNTQSMAQNITNIRNIIPNIPISEAAPANPLPLLESSLKAHEISSSQPLTGDRLMQMVRNAGTGLESKLLQLSQNPALSPAIQQDLKSIMLQLANQQGSNNQQTELVKTISELAQQSVSRIETTQALNLLAQVQGEPIRMELPMLVNQQMVNVQLSMQQQSSYEQNSPEENGSANQSFNVLFSLDLSQLGKIRVDANISDNTVHARIYNDSSECSRFLLDNIQRLETRLYQSGFDKVYLLASHQQPTAKKQQSFDQLTQMLPTSLHLLDIRI